jgi:hypothetical protein
MINDYLPEDKYKPPIPKPLLQNYDNYQIYSLVWNEIEVSEEIKDVRYLNRGYAGEWKNRHPSIQYPSPTYDYQIDGSQYTYTTNKYYYAVEGYQPRFSEPLTNLRTGLSRSDLIAYQQYSISKIPFDFFDIASKLNIKPQNKYSWRTLDSERAINPYHTTCGNNHPLTGLSVRDSNSVDASSYYQNVPAGEISIGGNQYKLQGIGQEDTYEYTKVITRANTSADYVSNHYTSYITKEFILTVSVAPQLPRLDVNSLISGYALDTRKKPNNYPKIKPTKSGQISIGYYRKNPFEPITTIISLDWMTYTVNIASGKEIHLPIKNAVFGTLCLSGDANAVADVKMQLSLIGSTVDDYAWSDFYYSNIDTLILKWVELQNNIIHPPKRADTENLLDYSYIEYGIPTIKKISANNNVWNNNQVSTEDISINDADLQYIQVSNIKAYNWHVKQQIDGSYGDLMMNSPKLEEIHAALNAGKYAINSLDPTKPKVTNVGHLVEKVAFLLGYRPDDNGEFSKAVEQTRVRKILPANKSVDPKKVGVNNFGDEGMILSRNINRFKNKDIVDDECVVIQDLIQLISEFQDRDNIAFGTQESSAVEINNSNGKSRYNNQLEMLIEIVNLVKDSNDMVRSALVSSLVTQGQTSEIIGGLGLPSVTKTLPVSIDGKDKAIPYKGIAAHRSISQEIATCAYNIGIVTGQLI